MESNPDHTNENDMTKKSKKSKKMKKIIKKQELNNNSAKIIEI